MAENLKGKSRNWGAAVEFLLLLIPVTARAVMDDSIMATGLPAKGS